MNCYHLVNGSWGWIRQESLNKIFINNKLNWTAQKLTDSTVWSKFGKFTFISELITKIEHHKEIQKLTFRALALRQIRFKISSALKFLHRGQFMWSTQLLNPNFCASLPRAPSQHHRFFRNSALYFLEHGIGAAMNLVPYYHTQDVKAHSSTYSVQSFRGRTFEVHWAWQIQPMFSTRLGH